MKEILAWSKLLYMQDREGFWQGMMGVFSPEMFHVKHSEWLPDLSLYANQCDFSRSTIVFDGAR